jgi:hypothetical protein
VTPACFAISAVVVPRYVLREKIADAAASTAARRSSAGSLVRWIVTLRGR